eukprot:TRINITY_DN105483_c0_g1_i1.p1 TRINITY_DN105483_c0_g1~~TRINITY_DN105483_c0_g1_i1.p1  ORF type:complete len:361 (-),score=55.20 TRINITY_DN105483_c0_g1_i1:74-1156(-)
MLDAASPPSRILSEFLQREDRNDAHMLEAATNSPKGSKAAQLGPSTVLKVRMMLASTVVVAWMALGSGLAGLCRSWSAKWAVYWFKAAPALASVAAACAELYLRTAQAKPRPRYLHLAGAFLCLCTLDSGFVAVTALAGCLEVHWLQVLLAIGIVVCEAGAFGVVQLMILLKVTTLSSDRSGGWPLRLLKAAAASLAAWALLFLQRIARHGAQGTAASSLENGAGLVFLALFLCFTGASVRQMFKAAAQTRFDKVLLAHAASTAVANSTAALRMVYIVASQHYQKNSVALRYVIVNWLDIVCNIFCALCVSGILAAALGGERASLVGRVDVLQDFARAAEAAIPEKQEEPGVRRRRLPGA